MVAEKVCKTARLIAFVLKNGVSKSKVVHGVNFMMKRGTPIPVAAMEYQFSCSGSPRRPSNTLSHVSKRKLSPMNSGHGNDIPARRRQYSREGETKACGHKIVNVKSCGGGHIRASALARVRSTSRRSKVTVTVTGSVSNDDAEEEYRVDEATEKFIEKFFRVEVAEMAG